MTNQLEGRNPKGEHMQLRGQNWTPLKIFTFGEKYDTEQIMPDEVTIAWRAVDEQICPHNAFCILPWALKPRTTGYTWPCWRRYWRTTHHGQRDAHGHVGDDIDELTPHGHIDEQPLGGTVQETAPGGIDNRESNHKTTLAVEQRTENRTTRENR